MSETPRPDPWKEVLRHAATFSSALPKAIRRARAADQQRIADLHRAELEANALIAQLEAERDTLRAERDALSADNQMLRESNSQIRMRQLAERDAAQQEIAELDRLALTWAESQGAYTANAKGVLMTLPDVRALQQQIATLTEAVRKSEEALKRLTADQHDCGDPGTECPMHDAHKSWHPVSEALTLIAALSTRPQEQP